MDNKYLFIIDHKFDIIINNTEVYNIQSNNHEFNINIIKNIINKTNQNVYFYIYNSKNISYAYSLIKYIFNLDKRKLEIFLKNKNKKFREFNISYLN